MRQVVTDPKIYINLREHSVTNTEDFANILLESLIENSGLVTIKKATGSVLRSAFKIALLQIGANPKIIDEASETFKQVATIY